MVLEAKSRAKHENMRKLKPRQLLFLYKNREDWRTHPSEMAVVVDPRLKAEEEGNANKATSNSSHNYPRY